MQKELGTTGFLHSLLDSLAPGRCINLKSVISEHMLQI